MYYNSINFKNDQKKNKIKSKHALIDEICNSDCKISPYSR